MRYLGLDIGSSSIKGALLDVGSGTISHIRSQPFPEAQGDLPALWFEIDPQAVVSAVRSLIENLLEDAGSCSGIFACGQMGGVLLADTQGRPLTNYLSWRDQRVLEPARSGKGSWLEELQRRISSRDLELIGNELRPGSAVSLLYWLVENGRLPDLGNRSRVWAMGLGEFVTSNLCSTPPCAHATQALGTWNLETKEWHRSLFEQLGLGGLSWPELIEPSQSVGQFPSKFGPIPCYAVIGDQQAALLGAGLCERELSINVSTGSQVGLLTPTVQLGDHQTRPYFQGRYLNTVTHLPAGRSLNVLVDFLCELAAGEGVSLRDPWTTIARAVDKTTSSDLDVSLAFFSGPVGSSGHVKNIRLDNLTVGHLFRAAFQHMADNFWHCACRISPDRAWDRIVLSGGLPQKLPVLRELIAARFGVPYRVVDAAEETLQGLLELARSF